MNKTEYTKKGLSEFRTLKSQGIGEKEGESDACQDKETLLMIEGLNFELNSDKKSYSVTGIGTLTASDVVIPSTYNDLPVTRIGYYTFNNCDSIISVTLGDSVTSIGESAFSGCNSLIEVYYAGSAEEWAKIDIASYNKYLTNATYYFITQNTAI